MRNLSTDALRAFVTIADIGSITNAAEHLGRSQPATSLQIKKLEETLGKTLFLRLNKKLKLSDDGQLLYEEAKKLLAINDQIVAQFSQAELEGQIKLGIPSEFATTILPKIVARFAAVYPNVTLEVFSDLSRNLTSEKQRDNYDLILALHDKKENKKRKGLICSDELVWVGTEQPQIDKEKDLPLILAQDGCLYRKRAIKQLNTLKRSWRIIHTNPDLTGIKAAIKEGLGITVLAKRTVPEDLFILDKLRYKLPELGAIDISLQYNRRTASNATTRLADFIHSSLV